jgi:hypothetical protein
MQAFKKVGLEALLTPDNCAVVMIDHQPFQLANVNSHEPTMVINNAIGLAMRLPGTAMVVGLGSGVQFSQLGQNIVMTRVGDRAIFQAENAQNRPQLWSSDGTAQGTVPLIATPKSQVVPGTSNRS